MASRGVNKVILVGNLGQDPEVRYMPNGGAVANITLATSESWRDKATGEMKEQTEWHRVVLFGKLAEVASEYLRKGSQVYIEGQLRTRKWTDQSGQDRYTTEVVVNVGGTMQMPLRLYNVRLRNNRQPCDLTLLLLLLYSSFGGYNSIITRYIFYQTEFFVPLFVKHLENLFTISPIDLKIEPAVQA